MSVKEFCYEGHCSKSGLSGREISPSRCNRQASRKGSALLCVWLWVPFAGALLHELLYLKVID